MNHRLLQAVLVFCMLVVLSAAAFAVWQNWETNQATNNTNQHTIQSGFVAFTSVKDFNAYIQLGAQRQVSGSLAQRSAEFGGLEASDMTGKVGLGASSLSPSPTLDRASTTNVQVAGIDEPDIVKTDGQSLFVSSNTQYYSPLLEDTIGSPNSSAGSATKIWPTPDVLPIKPTVALPTTAVIDALPPSALAKIGSIDTTGEMLLVDHTLVVLAPARYPDQKSAQLAAYNIGTPTTPVKSWTDTLAENDMIVTARLRQGKIYLLVQTQLNRATPCPLKALRVGTTDVVVPCTDIYHPTQPVSTDTTYTVMVINPIDGSLDQRLSFVGVNGATTVAMFNDSLYVAYTDAVDPVTYEFDFLNQTGHGLLPAAYQARVDRLQTYDLSVQAKVAELSAIFEEYAATLTLADQESFQKNMTEKMQAFGKAHVRDYVFTNVVRVGLNDFRVLANGRVPGTVLNQYALDEYQGHLRLATTSSGSGSWWFGNNADSINDVYVLDDGLNQTSAVMDLGKGEQIYAVRFVGALGYVVTFRQTDPLYVLNLADPNGAVVAGQLKIPGYSAYLHPLTETLVLGIGQEDSHIKATIFDVSQPDQPAAVSTLALDQYTWTDIQQNPHAFLHDPTRQVVFIPVGVKGVVISYANQKLSIAASVANVQAQRAIYINDTMYIIGTSSVTALDEQTWTVTKQLTW